MLTKLRSMRINFQSYFLGMSIELNSMRYENDGAPVLVVLHGLLGSSRNWSTVGRALQKQFDVHLVDLRNHGQSSHAESMRWAELVKDLENYYAKNGIQDATLMGHSLGGKVCMRFACEHPEWVNRLVIVDIAAKAYSPHLDQEFRAMKSIALGELSNRKEAEEVLVPLIEDWAHRQFLLTNLIRDENTGGFRWQINVEALHASLPHIRQTSLEDWHAYEGPVLLVRGELSHFIDDGDAEAMRGAFPALNEVIVDGAGHNVHIENRKGFLSEVSRFLA